MSRFPGTGEIMVHGGNYVEPLNMSAAHIDIEWVAHSLANLGRYTGHTHMPTWGGLARRIWRRFYNPTALYSVAQHCVLGSMWLEEQGYGPEYCLGFLLHDATEAVVNDLARPVKHLLPSYIEAEKHAAPLFARSLGVRYDVMDAPEVHWMDRVMCATEQRDLMRDPKWPGWPAPSEHRIEPWLPAKAKRMYLARYHYLLQVVLWSQVQK